MHHVIVHHHIQDEDAYFAIISKTNREQPTPPKGLTLHWVHPSKNKKATFCLWEAAEVRQVQEFLDNLFGPACINECVEVDEQLTAGLAGERVNAIRLESEKKQVELEMQTLRTQMNPHFIFNSLNSVNRYILANDPKSASAYLTKFSRLMRMILQNSQSQFISLESEMEALQLYLELESLRFEQQFNYEISYDEQEMEPDFIKLPPMLIQPYVENAIWHGLMHKPSKGLLQIDLNKDNEYIICKITDNGVGRTKAAAMNSKSATQHKSMGTTITANRLAMMEKLTNKEESVIIKDLVDAAGEPSGTEVTLKIPFLYD